MIFEIPQTGESAWLSAFKTRPESIEITLKTLGSECPSASVQLVDLDKIPGHIYLTLATVNATTSFRSKQPITRTLSMEILLYVAGKKQIHEALSSVGVTAATRRVAAIIVGKQSSLVLGAANVLTRVIGQEDDDRLLDEWTRAREESVRAQFEIGELELRAAGRKGELVTSTLERLAIERSALLAARR